MQTQEKEKERKEGKEKHKKKKKEKIHDLRTRIFVRLFRKFKVNTMIIMYKNS